MRAQTLFNPLRRRMTVLLVLLAAVSGLLLPGASPASADTPRRQVSWTWMHVYGWGHAEMARAYEALIISIRNAAGHDVQDDVYETQTEPESLISVRLYDAEGYWVRLWLEPRNLYLRGFSNMHGTFRADDPEYNLQSHLTLYGRHASNDQNTGFDYNPPVTRVLPFDSTYIDINSYAGRDRSQVYISAGAMWEAFRSLVFVQDPWAGGYRQNTARAYQFFTQFISEAVRFDDIFWYMRAAMANNDWQRPGMGENQITLENNWGRISDWAWRARTEQNPGPLIIAGLATLYNWRDVKPVLNVAKHR